MLLTSYPLIVLNMINQIILDQLEKTQIAKHDGYDEIKHQFVFKKNCSIKLEVNKCYAIKLNKSLLDETINDSLMYNLNRGTFPKYDEMRVDVIKINQRLILVNGTYTSNAGFWSGWLPIDQIEIIEEI